MRRTLQVLFDLRSSWRQAWLTPLLLAPALVWIGWHSPPMAGLTGIFLGILAASVRDRWWPAWLTGLSGSARGFRRVADSRIVLYVDPQCEGRVETRELFRLCGRQLDELAEWFGFTLRRRLVVFLYADSGEIQRIRGMRVGGFAVPPDAIVVVATPHLEAVIRHELAHLFARRWNGHPATLLDEGLATWLQGRIGGTPLEAHAQQVLDRHPPKLADLLFPQRFRTGHDRHANYIMAGSFTGFLLRRYGKERYQRLFQRSAGPLIEQLRFEAVFEDSIGVPLRDAEHRWRVEVLVMPIFEKRLAGGLASGPFAA